MVWIKEEILLQIHVQADADTGRLTAVSKDFSTGTGDQVIQVPDDFQLDRHMDYRLVDGTPVYDPLPEPEEPSPTLGDRLLAVESDVGSLDAVVVDLAYQNALLSLGITE